MIFLPHTSSQPVLFQTLYFHRPYWKGPFSKVEAGPRLVTKAGGPPSPRSPSSFGRRPRFHGPPELPPRVPGRGAQGRPRPALPRDPTRRAGTQGPLPRRPRRRGLRSLCPLGEGGGVASPLGGRPCRRPAPIGRCLRAPKSNPRTRRLENLRQAGAQLACQVTFCSGASLGSRTCSHFPALPAGCARGRHKTRMATPPKRSCPSPATGSEGTRIKKIAIEGNIGKESWEMFPKQGEPRRRRQP